MLTSLSVRQSQAFAPGSGKAFIRSMALNVNIAEGVDFDTVAREWRCKWSPDNDKASLVAAQKALEAVLPEIKKIDGVQNVERVVCGGCLDFKVRECVLFYSSVGSTFLYI